MFARLVLLVITFISISTWSLFAVEISDVEIPEQISKDGLELVLNGAGTRSKFFMDLYVSALYLENKSQDAVTILREELPMGLRLHIVSGLIDNESLRDAITDGFDASTGGNTQPIQAQIDKFMSLMQAEINKGDYFDFIYLPASGLKIYKNQQYMDSILGLNFKRAFFGIWLGDDPVDDDLKEEMLGL